MKTERTFVAQRPLAQHCPQLVRPSSDPVQLLPSLRRTGELLARRLGEALAPLLGGQAPVLRCLPLQTGTIATIRDAAEHPLAADSLFAIGAGIPPVLITMSAAPVFRIVDRAFGGKGVAPSPLPLVFPMAADLMIVRLEKIIGAQINTAIAAVMGGDSALPAAATITPQGRNGSLADLAPFAEDQPLAILTIEVQEADAPVWILTMALAVTALPALFGGDAGRRQEPATARAGRPTLGDAIAMVPLTLSALIVDMRLPFAVVAGLTPGQVLPVVVARNIPLRVGPITVAHGTIGAVDEHVAIQITSAFAH